MVVFRIRATVFLSTGAQIQFFLGGGVRSRDRVFIRGRDRLL